MYYPERHNTRTPYIHLFTFLQHASRVLFGGHHQSETQLHIRRDCYGRVLSFTIFILVALRPNVG